MAYFAFDPDRVRALSAAMSRALAELQPLRCDDPAAADAMRAVRLARADLEATWLPLTRRALDSTALTTGGPPADLGEVANSLAYVMTRGYGWSAAIDPMPAARADATVTVEAARALGARMNTLDAVELADDPEALQWTARHLEIIARDPALAAAFLSNFDEWGPWGDALGRQRALLLAYSPRTTVTVADLDAVFAGLAHVQRTALPAEHLSTDLWTLLPWIDEMSPYSAAVIVQCLGLAGNDLAALGDRLVQRAMDVRVKAANSPLTDLDALPGPGTGDLLAPLLLADPVAGSRFVLFAQAHPRSLLNAFEDTADAYAFLLAATDPARMPVDVAGDVVPGLVSSFRNTEPMCDEECQTSTGRPDDRRRFLVDLVAPWLLQFSPQNTDWRISNDVADDMLAFVLDDDASLRRLVDRADRVAAGFITSLESGPPRRLEELGAFMAMIGGLVVNERVVDETERQESWSLVATLAGLLTSAIPGIAVAAGVSLGLLIVSSVAGPDPVKAAHQAGYGADLAITTAGAAVASQVTDHWKQQGVLPADFPPPPVANPHAELPSQSFLWAFTAWRERLPGGMEGELSFEVTARVFALVNPSLMGEHSVTLFMP